ncbi:MAG: hypothetical protein OEZ34_07425 [Spirochaetia bacterium]|nr:hypothetical protein [Spirochaetia bacterium]
MILVILYIGAGLYMLLMTFGLVQKEFVKQMDRNRKIGLAVFGVSLIVLGFYNIYYYYYR